MHQNALLQVKMSQRERELMRQSEMSTGGKPASTDSNTPHLASVHSTLYVYMFVRLIVFALKAMSV